MRVGSLFSGIGGLDLGLERAGMSVAWQCEIDPYCRAVLAHHWPGVPCYEDIREVDGSAESVDLVCGGFPCQPVSLAGKGLAQKDPRWLWPEFARVVGLLRPRYVLVENVPGLVRQGLADVVGDLAALGYDAEWQIVSAASVGAPHLRERVIVVAYPGGERRQQVAGSSCSHEASYGWRTGEDHVLAGDGEGSGAGQIPPDVADADGQRFPEWGERDSHSAQSREQAPFGHNTSGLRPALADSDCQLLDWGRDFGKGGRSESSDRRGWFPEPDVGRVADGVPNRVAQLRGLGNAVVPQVAEFVGRLILEAEARAAREEALARA